MFRFVLSALALVCFAAFADAACGSGGAGLFKNGLFGRRAERAAPVAAIAVHTTTTRVVAVRPPVRTVVVVAAPAVAQTPPATPRRAAALPNDCPCQCGCAEGKPCTCRAKAKSAAPK